MTKKLLYTTVAAMACILPMQAALAGGKAFPKIVPALEGAPPEGFTIGKGTTAYNASLDGSIYKINLRNGQGEVLVPGVPGTDVIAGDCYRLGIRVDPRSNYLFAANCFYGSVSVFDADTGVEINEYQFTNIGESVLNDLTITQDAVYFTDFGGPFLYRLPLSRNGRIPDDAAGVTPIPLTGDFDTATGPFANGIVATPNGKTLIVGHSGVGKIYRVDPATGHSDEIVVTPPLTGFLDGIVMYDGVLFILTPDFPDKIQVVTLDEEMLTGTLVGIITDDDMDGVASGAMHGDSLYVNGARYSTFPEATTEYWVTKLDIYDIEPAE